MNNSDFNRVSYDGLPTREYRAHDVEKQYKSSAALLSQTTALIFFTIFIFLLFLPGSEFLRVTETIVSGVILCFSVLTVLFVLCQSWEDSTFILRLSMTVVVVLSFGALFLDTLNPLSKVMFGLYMNITIAKYLKIIFLMLLPLSLFPALFLSDDEIHKSNIKALWFYVVTIIPLLILRIIPVSSFIS